MVPPRPGPAHAGRGLRSTLGLAWRLQRGVLLVWAIGLVGLGAAFGAVGKSAEDLLTDNAQVAQMFARLSPGADVIDVYFTVLMAIVGTAAAGYTVQALLRMRAEEDTGRLEPVLATPVGRHQWLASHAIIAAGGTTAILALAGLAGGLVYGGMVGEWSASVRDVLAAALVQAPAALALGGFVLAVFGLLPRWAGPITWFALAAALVMGQLGSLFDLPQWLLNVSPFSHVPLVPAEPFTATPVVWLLLARAALGATGVRRFPPPGPGDRGVSAQRVARREKPPSTQPRLSCRGGCGEEAGVGVDRLARHCHHQAPTTREESGPRSRPGRHTTTERRSCRRESRS